MNSFVIAVGEEDSDNESLDQGHKDPLHAGTGGAPLGLKSPVVELPSHCKEDLTLALEKLDREISKTEQKMGKLKDLKVSFIHALPSIQWLFVASTSQKL